MKKQSKHIAILSFAVLLILTLQFILTGCSFGINKKNGSNVQESSSGTMTRTTENDATVVYFDENRYVEDKSAVFIVDQNRADEYENKYVRIATIIEGLVN